MSNSDRADVQAPRLKPFYLRYKPTPDAPWTIVAVPQERFGGDVMDLVDYVRTKMFTPEEMKR